MSIKLCNYGTQLVYLDINGYQEHINKCRNPTYVLFLLAYGIYQMFNINVSLLLNSDVNISIARTDDYVCGAPFGDKKTNPKIKECLLYCNLIVCSLSSHKHSYTIYSYSLHLL
jgi:hypothetical protein